jgi:nitrous oxidase accessory protein NosD
MSARRWLLVALIAALVAPAAAQAHRTTVVGAGHSIQAAVDAARPGDTVVVRGVHRENVAIQTDRLTLRGVGAVLLPPAIPTPHACFDPTEIGEAVHGICVIGDVDFEAGEVSRYVEGVTVSGFTVRGFAGSALAAVGARATTFVGNVATGNEDGIRSTASIRTTVVANRASGGHFGVRVASSVGDRIVANTLRDNCVGTFVLSTPAGVAGDLRMTGNTVDHNTRACPGDEDFPELSGIGVGLVGTSGVTITGNRITGNVPGGETAAGGGVVALASPDGTPLNGTVVRGNVIRGNDPDILWDETGTGNVFGPNLCGSSSPVALCDRV